MIRNVREEDASALQMICAEALGHIADAEMMKQQIASLSQDEHYFIRVCEDPRTGRVTGFIEAEKYSLLYGGNGWNVIALAVSEDLQGQGIGRQLLSALEAHAVSEGDSFIRLNCNIKRTDAHEFYTHLGYGNDKTQKRFIRYL